MESEVSPASGASQYLQHLPSRGCFSSFPAVPFSTSGGLRVYICDHDTSPPEEQLIKTDTTNILIRALTLKKGKGEQKPKESKGKIETLKGKRPADKAADERAPTKRINTGSAAGSRRDGSSSRPSDRELQGYTVEKLKSLLKEKGLPLKGKKEELIARLRRT